MQAAIDGFSGRFALYGCRVSAVAESLSECVKDSEDEQDDCGGFRRAVPGCDVHGPDSDQPQGPQTADAAGRRQEIAGEEAGAV